jgi:DNA (cytosine-5)-methyltransferase 1
MFSLTSTDRHAIAGGMLVRRLTPLECERLQGFPDGWTEGHSDTNRYKQMGNAVAVPVVEWIVQGICDTFDIAG